MDMVISMNQMPLCGETVLGKSITHIPGGKGANQACSVGKLGGDVTMLGCVGEDQLGTELLKNLELAGVEEVAKCLLKKGVGNVLVTLGSRGAMLMNQERCEIFPVRKVEAVDTTAAGDCFNGAFATGLAEEMAIEDAIVFGNLASSIAVTRASKKKFIDTRIII